MFTVLKRGINMSCISLRRFNPEHEPIIEELNIIYAVESIVNLFKGNEVRFSGMTRIEYLVKDLSLESRKSLTEKGHTSEKISAGVNFSDTIYRIQGAFRRGIPGMKLDVYPIYDNGEYGGHISIDEYIINLVKTTKD
jgi:hypothetical protein